MLMIPLLFMEASLQLLYRFKTGSFLCQRTSLPIYELDNDRYYKLKPNLAYRHRTNEYDVYYYTNNQGFRTDKNRNNFETKKPADVYRIMFLGPSFTMGWGNNFEDIYPTLIGNKLVVPGKHVEILNIGTAAQPPNNQLRWLKRVGYKFNPDMVIQTVYGDSGGVLNSCDTELDRPPLVKNGYLIDPNANRSRKTLAILKQSATVFYGWYIYNYFTNEHTSSEGLGLELYKTVPSTTRLKHRGEIEAYLKYKDFVRASLGKSIPVVFMHLPFSYVVRPTDSSRWTNSLHGGVDPFKKRESEALLANDLKSGGLNIINTADALIKSDKNNRMYYYLDIHLTKLGNKIVADEAVPIIQNLIDKNSTSIPTK